MPRGQAKVLGFSKMLLFVYCVLVTWCVGKIEIVCRYVWACVLGCSRPGLERGMSDYRESAGK